MRPNLGETRWCFIKKKSNFGANAGETARVRLRRLKPGLAVCAPTALAIRAKLGSEIHFQK